MDLHPDIDFTSKYRKQGTVWNHDNFASVLMMYEITLSTQDIIQCIWALSDNKNLKLYWNISSFTFNNALCLKTLFKIIYEAYN